MPLDQYSFLYVEDDEMNRLALRAVFEHVIGVRSFHVFEDSANFMARLKALPETPTVILLDIQVKPYNGFEMLHMLREDPAYCSTRVIAITASIMGEQVEQLRDSGFNGVIGKPINLGAFPDVIERVIKGEAVWQLT